MELAAAEWRYDQLHEEEPFHNGDFTHWNKERSEEFPFHYRDGVRLFVAASDLDPDDDFLTPRKRNDDEGEVGRGDEA